MLLSQTYAQVNLNQGLAGYWNFNGNTNAVSGNNNNATNFGAILTTALIFTTSKGNTDCGKIFKKGDIALVR